MDNFRLIKATNMKNQVFNETGPGLKDKQCKCEQIMSELQNMNQGNKRDISILSIKTPRLLAEEVDNPDDYYAMHARMDEYRSKKFSYIGRKP